MKRVAIISAVNPYPTDAGKKVVLAGLLDYFIERLSPDHVHYLLIGGKNGDTFPARLGLAPAPTPRQAMTNLLTRTAFGRRSIQESFLWSSTTNAEVQKWLSIVGAQVELYDTIRTAQYAPDSSRATRICYLDDLFSERYASMLSAVRVDKRASIRPLGNFARYVPARLHFLTENPMSQKALLAAEAHLVAKSENRVARSFDRCLLVNEHEANLLRRRAGVPRKLVETIPPLVKASGTTNREYRGVPQFLFLGLLSLPHNDYGLRAFICDTWPLILRRLPSARLKIVGREPQPELLAAVSTYGKGSISLEGYVADLRSLMAESAALVNPLHFGSGVKLKIIEALSQRLPVVSSEIGANGMLGGVENGICLAKEPDEWVNILEGLTSPRYNSDVSEAAASHFERIYSRDAVFAAYDSVFRLG